MSCMCGDTACPSCGPAQGHNPAFERACEWIDNVLLVGISDAINREWLVEELANRLGDHQPICDAIDKLARDWERRGYK